MVDVLPLIIWGISVIELIVAGVIIGRRSKKRGGNGHTLSDSVLDMPSFYLLIFCFLTLAIYGVFLPLQTSINPFIVAVYEQWEFLPVVFNCILGLVAYVIYVLWGKTRTNSDNE
ncbi:MAG: hypothetical protein LKJ47_05225 [Bifidobacteriaceae bacterium]|jgi:hypothetical protein|nr:hypothetical protein [Bifidobacteriaceae bacterium]